MNEGDEKTQSVDVRLAKLESAVQHLEQLQKMTQVHQMHTAVEKELALHLFRRLGLNEIDGLPLEDWWHQQQKIQLEKALIAIEDLDPASAAYLQSNLDEAEDKSDNGTI